MALVYGIVVKGPTQFANYYQPVTHQERQGLALPRRQMLPWRLRLQIKVQFLTEHIFMFIFLILISRLQILKNCKHQLRLTIHYSAALSPPNADTRRSNKKGSKTMLRIFALNNLGEQKLKIQNLSVKTVMGHFLYSIVLQKFLIC